MVKKIMAASDLPAERGAEAPELVGREWLGLAQQGHGMAERLARITEALCRKFAALGRCGRRLLGHRIKESRPANLASW